MTVEEWKKVETELSSPFGYVKLKIDGYNVTIQTQPDKPLHYALVVYIDGLRNN